MKNILKYPFEINDTVTIRMPGGAKVLSIQYQGNIPTIWAMVDTYNREAHREFFVFGTGHDIPSATTITYLATIQDPNGFVWHIFE